MSRTPHASATGRRADAASRHGAVTRLRPERREDYLALHRAVWPEVTDRLRRSNVRNYTIFVVGDLLISYYEHVGDDWAADMDRVARDPVTRRWWELTDPCQLAMREEATERPWSEGVEVWHLD